MYICYQPVQPFYFLGKYMNKKGHCLTFIMEYRIERSLADLLDPAVRWQRQQPEPVLMTLILCSYIIIQRYFRAVQGDVRFGVSEEDEGM